MPALYLLGSKQTIMAGQTINVDQFVAMMINTDAESLSSDQEIDLNDEAGDEINLSLQIMLIVIIRVLMSQIGLVPAKIQRVILDIHLNM